MSSKCVFQRGGKACSREFAGDGHSLCVTHRPCVSADYVYNPEMCVICTENVKFLRTLGRVDCLSHHFTSLRRSWAAVQHSARRAGLPAAWRDSELREFLLGRGSRRSSRSASSSVDRASSEASPGPSSAPAPGTRRSPVRARSSSVPASPPPASPPPSPPGPSVEAPAPAPAPSSPPAAAPPFILTPELRSLLSALLASSAPTVPPPPAAGPAASPLPHRVPSPAVPPASPGPAPGPSAAAPPPSSPPYGVESSPISDVESSSEPAVDHLPRGWAPVPVDWEVRQEGLSWVLMCPDPAAPGLMALVPDLQVRWGTSRYRATAQWHFKALPPPAPELESLPVPSEADLHSALAALALWAGLSPPGLAPAGPEASRRAFLLSWMQGQATNFLRPFREWWQQAAHRTTPPLPRLAARCRVPVLPAGDDWDAQAARFLLARPPTAFPPPLSTPSAEAVRGAERVRAHALESFSGLSLALALEALVRQLASVPDLGARLSPSELCDFLLPVLQSMAHHLAPGATVDFGEALAAQLALWRQASSHLPPATQAVLLSGDPCSPSFGSPQAVAEALARAPQVAYVYQGQPAPPPSSSRSRPTSSSSRHRGSSAAQARPRPRQDSRPRPYQLCPSRSGASASAPPRPSRDVPPPSRRGGVRPFRDAPSGRRGARY